MADVQTQIGMKVNLFNTELFGGYEFKDKKHMLIVKQTNPGEAGKPKSVKEFIDEFAGAVNGLTGGNLPALKIDWPPEIAGIVEPFQVYVKEVFLYIERGEDSAGAQNNSQFAFWIGIRMDPALIKAIKAGEKEYNGKPIPAIFKIFQLEDLYLKIWQFEKNDRIKEEMQLEDLKQKYLTV